MWQRWLRRGLLCVVFLLASSLVYVLVTRTQTGFSTPPPPEADLTRGEAGIEQFTFRQSREGQLKWEVKAERAEMYEREREARLETVEVTLYGRQGPELVLHGEQGTIDTERRDFVLSNKTRPLEVALDGGYTVYTNQLAWNEAEGELRTDRPVTVVGNGMVVEGKGLVGKLDAEEFQVQHDVRVQIAP